MFSIPYSVQEKLFAVAEAFPPIARAINHWAINRSVRRARPRPHPMSTASDFVSWKGMTDREWSGRHLPPCDRTRKSVEDVAALFKRSASEQRLCPKSTCLFPAFAQYLTDGFIRTESEGFVRKDPKTLEPQPVDEATRLRRNSSNHDIDLCPLYGRTPEQTRALRSLDESPGKRGRLKVQTIKGEDYPHYLYNGDTVKPEFAILDAPLGESDIGPGRRAKLFAVGGDRANSVPQVSMMNTLFLREHNRLAAMIEDDNPDWSDEQVFETARNTNIVQFIKIVVEDYINHISPLPFRLKADPSVAWKAEWNKANWITTEFSLLYRWHALIPDQIRWGETHHAVGTTFMDNSLLIDRGLLGAFEDMSANAAGELGPHNTTDALLHVEQASLHQDAVCELATFSDYRDYLGYRRPVAWSDITSNQGLATELAGIYSQPSEMDFYAGLHCEDRVPNSPLPPTILSFVALDAFSQALTNPLMSKDAFKQSTFSPTGWRSIKRTDSLRDVVLRNVSGGEDSFISMTRKDWVPE